METPMPIPTSLPGGIDGVEPGMPKRRGRQQAYDSKAAEPLSPEEELAAFAGRGTCRHDRAAEGGCMSGDDITFFAWLATWLPFAIAYFISEVK